MDDRTCWAYELGPGHKQRRPGLHTGCFGCRGHDRAFGSELQEAGPKRLSKCGVLSSAGGQYVLAQDVSSPGTCFSVQVDGVTLDLNSHTVTYGSEAGMAPAFGILGVLGSRLRGQESVWWILQ